MSRLAALEGISEQPLPNGVVMTIHRLEGKKARLSCSTNQTLSNRESSRQLLEMSESRSFAQMVPMS